MDKINNQVTEMLMNLWEKKCMAHFYIAKTSLTNPNPREYLTHFLENLMAKIFSKELALHEENALRQIPEGRFADLLVLSPKNNKNYHIDDFNEFFRFLEFSSFEISYKFVIINDAHLLTETISNKLLKSLEAPPNPTTIFLIDHQNSLLLETLSGRGVNLFVNSPDSELTSSPKEIAIKSKEDLSLFLQEKGFNSYELIDDYLKKKIGTLDLIDKMKKREMEFEELISLIAEFETTSLSQFSQKDQMLEFIKFYTDSKKFHNNVGTRIYKLSQMINQY